MLVFARFVFPLVLAAFAMGGSAGCSNDGGDTSQTEATQTETDAQGDAQGDAQADTIVPVPVEAEGFASLTGVASYELALVPDGAPDAPPTATIALLDVDGVALGTIAVALEPTGLSASIPSPDGPIVYRAGAALDADRLFVTNSVSVAGRG